VHRVLELELERIENIITKIITIIITITDKNYNYSNTFVISDYISVYADHAIDKQISSAD